MLTHEEFATLEVGDQILCGPMLPLVSDEAIRLQVTTITPEKAEFAILYYRITLGEVSLVKPDEGFEWLQEH